MTIINSKRLQGLTTQGINNSENENEQDNENEHDVIADGDANREQPVRKQKKRKQSHAADVWALKDGRRVIVKFDKLDRPYGKGALILGDFLGTVARKGNLCPLNLKNWKKAFDTDKAQIMKHIQTFFTIPNRSKVKRNLLKSVGDKWRKYKYHLKKLYFNPTERSLDEIIKNVPELVYDYQWKELVIRWDSVEKKRASRAGKEARKCVRTLHASGPISFAEREHRFREANNRTPTRLEAFGYQHKHKDGSFINEFTQQIMERATNLVAEKSMPDISEAEKLELENEVYDDLVGLDKFGRVRGYGMGVTARDLSEANIFGDSSNHGDERFETLIKDYQVNISKYEAAMSDMTARVIRTEEEARAARDEALLVHERAEHMVRAAQEAQAKALEDAKAEFHAMFLKMKMNQY